MPENKRNILLYVWISFQVFPVLLMAYLWNIAVNKYDLPLSLSKTKMVSNGPWSFYYDLSEGLAIANFMYLLAFFLSILVYVAKGKEYGALCSSLALSLFVTNFIAHFNMLD